MSESTLKKAFTPKRILLAVAVIAAVGALFYLGRQGAGYVPRFAEWVAGLGFWGPLVFILGYAAATVAFIPGSVLTLAAGAVFGLAEGTLYAFLGATLGACSAFLVGRYLARGFVERRLGDSEKFAAIDKAVGREGLEIVLLLRLSPVFPFNLLNYALGLSRVRFVQYAIACLGMLPGTFLYVYYGHAAGSLAQAVSDGSQQRGMGSWILLGVGLVATIAVTVLVTRLARRALEEKADV